MGIFDRVRSLRSLLSGTKPAADEERLLQLYWNRAELKKELARLQAEHHQLLEHIQTQEADAVRSREYLHALEQYLGDPDIAPHAMAYFQLRALWRTAAGRLARFSQHLQQQQIDRERQAQLREFEMQRDAQLAGIEHRIDEARYAADQLLAQMRDLESKLHGLRGFWHYFRRRRLARELEACRAKWDLAETAVTDVADDRGDVEHQNPPTFPGLSLAGRRIVNLAVIAQAQQFVMMLSKGGLAVLAKQATTQRVFDVHYGDREQCVRLLALLRDGIRWMEEGVTDPAALKARIGAIEAAAVYRTESESVPLAESVAPLSLPALTGSDATGEVVIDVLADDYWDVYRALIA
jgi:hypothetical protein